MLSGEILINEQQVQLKILKVLDLVYSQKLHHIVEQEPMVKYNKTLLNSYQMYIWDMADKEARISFSLISHKKPFNWGIFA